MKPMNFVAVGLQIRGDITFTEDVDEREDFGVAHPVVEAPKFVSMELRHPRTSAPVRTATKRAVKSEETPKKAKKKKIKKEKA